jgi:uncharacterized membrane-anchored protein
LISLLTKPLLIEDYLPISQPIALAIATPIVFFGSILVILRIRKKLHN